MAEITSIEQSEKNARRVVVCVDGRRAATLSAGAVRRLGVAVGRAWDEGLKAKVSEVVQVEKALGRAAKIVGRRPVSGREMGAKLARAGFEQAVCEKAKNRLMELGLIDDEKLGRGLMEEWCRKGAVGPDLIREKLSRRGLGTELIERLIAEQEGAGRDDDVLAGAKEKLLSLKGVDGVTRRRRLRSWLHRRGFDEEAARGVMEKLGLLLPGSED